MIKILNKYYEPYSFIFPCIIAATLPFIFQTGFLVFLWLVFFVFIGPVWNGLKLALKNPWFYIVVSFFILHVLALLYTHNKHEGGVSIEIKLSFIAYPLVFFTHQFNLKKIQWIVWAFILGCIGAGAYDIGRGIYYYITQHTLDYLYYSQFSHFMHPSYFAMYLCLASLVIIRWFPIWYIGKKWLWYVIFFLVAFMGLCVFFSSSKMGLMAYLLLIPFSLGYYLFLQKKYIWILSIIGILILGFFVAKKTFPEPFERIENAMANLNDKKFDKTSTESSVVRKYIWMESVKIIQQHFWIGVSPGDTNDELYKAYEEHGLTGALEKHLNAHNQFIQTFIGLGIIGFLIMLILTVGTMIWGILKKNMNLVLFSLLIVLNFLVESMLQTQAGVLFYVFFLCFFLQFNFATFEQQNNQMVSKLEQ